MAIRTRLRAISFPIWLYALSGAIAGYFVWHRGPDGQRCLETRLEDRQKTAALGSELNDLKSEC